MPTCRIPSPTKSHAIVECPQGRGAGGWTVGLPPDAESEVVLDTPFICRARMQDGRAKLAGEARLPE